MEFKGSRFAIFYYVTRLLLIVLTLIISITNVIIANDEVDDIFTNANTHYLSGEYDEALSNYLSLDELGIRSPELYFNIANSYLMIESPKIGKAIVYYNRALLFKPHNKKYLENLEHAKTLVTGGDNTSGQNNTSFIFAFFNFFYQSLSIDVLTILILIFLTSFTILITIYFFYFRNNKAIFRFGLSSGVILIVVSILFFFRLYFDVFTNYGVIVSKESKVYSSPSEEQAILFLLSEGTELEIKSKISNDWYLISLPNGIEGYIKYSEIEAVKNFTNNR